MILSENTVVIDGSSVCLFTDNPEGHLKLETLNTKWQWTVVSVSSHEEWRDRATHPQNHIWWDISTFDDCPMKHIITFMVNEM